MPNPLTEVLQEKKAHAARFKFIILLSKQPGKLNELCWACESYLLYAYRPYEQLVLERQGIALFLLKYYARSRDIWSTLLHNNDETSPARWFALRGLCLHALSAPRNTILDDLTFAREHLRTSHKLHSLVMLTLQQMGWKPDEGELSDDEPCFLNDAIVRDDARASEQDDERDVRELSPSAVSPRTPVIRPLQESRLVVLSPLSL